MPHKIVCILVIHALESDVAAVVNLDSDRRCQQTLCCGGRGCNVAQLNLPVSPGIDEQFTVTIFHASGMHPEWIEKKRQERFGSYAHQMSKLAWKNTALSAALAVRLDRD